MSQQSVTPNTPRQSETWLIVGASRGIGLEFTRQLLAQGCTVFATARNPSSSPLLSDLEPRDADDSKGKLHIVTCDVTSEASISSAVGSVWGLCGGGCGGRTGDNDAETTKVDYAVINAGVLKYPNRATEADFANFALHMTTNAVGPLIAGQRLLNSGLSVGTLAFMSSDSGSALQFRGWEDGFAAYSASKAALNQGLRHMAAELERKGEQTVVLALHPGEVPTEMADVELPWEIEGIVGVVESVRGMIKVLRNKTIEHSGTFWTWENEQHPW